MEVMEGKEGVSLLEETNKCGPYSTYATKSTSLQNMEVVEREIIVLEKMEKATILMCP
jgi:hypothetical protein